MSPGELRESLRYDLLRYLLATSEERARVLGELRQRKSKLFDILAELEADPDLKARVEMELLSRADAKPDR